MKLMHHSDHWHSMTKEARIECLSIILRLGIDRVITDSLDLATQLSDTIASLVGAFANSEADQAVYHSLPSLRLNQPLTKR